MQIILDDQGNEIMVDRKSLDLRNSKLKVKTDKNGNKVYMDQNGQQIKQEDV